VTDRPDDAAHTVVLVEVPGLAGVYARGATSAARLAVSRRTRPTPPALPGVELVVRGVRPDADRLTAYQRLVGETGSDELPAGYVHVLTFPVSTALMARADFPLSLLGMVHVANRITQLRPVRLGEVLDMRVCARDLRAHRSGAQVDLVAEVTVDGELVWTGTSTYLAKGVQLLGAPAPGSDDGASSNQAASDEAESDEAGDRDGSAALGGGRRPFEAPAPTGRWHLGRDIGRQYATVSGDRNPIHLSALSAKALGFPRAIAHGMYTAARGLAGVGAARGDSYEWTVEFAKPVLLPSSPSVRIARDDDGFDLTLWNQDAHALHLTSRVTPEH
jgi:acyl dehydratase